MTPEQALKAIREILAKQDQHEPEAIPFQADWTKAPTWARWAAADECGEAIWYEFEPKLAYDFWDIPEFKDRCSNIKKAHFKRGTVHWTKAIEKRPE